MANPQLEDGHLRIANEVWDALARTRISGQCRQVLDVIIRKTWGFNKKRDAIALSQFSNATGLRKSHVSRAIDQLLKMNIIKRFRSPNIGDTTPTTYSVNKDYATWGGVPIKGVSPKTVQGIPQNGKGVSPKKGHTKDTLTKDTIQKTERLLSCKQDDGIPYDLIVAHLNKVTGRNFRVGTGKTRGWISGRWKDGYRTEDFFHVHIVKAEQWIGTEREKFLRPKTLYTPDNFEGYRQERRNQCNMTDKARNTAAASIQWLKSKGFEIDSNGHARIPRATKQISETIQQTD
jgi:phage replication O-like protein O